MYDDMEWQARVDGGELRQFKTAQHCHVHMQGDGQLGFIAVLTASAECAAGCLAGDRVQQRWSLHLSEFHAVSLSQMAKPSASDVEYVGDRPYLPCK